MTFWPCTGLVLCETTTFNATATSASGERFRAGQGPGLQQSSLEHKSIQAGRIWYSLYNVTASSDVPWVAPWWWWRATAPLAVWEMQLRNLWENINFCFPTWLLCRELQPGHGSGKRQSLGGGNDTSLEVPNPFWSCLVSWELSLAFLSRPILKWMFLILFLRLRAGLSSMQYLRRQQETDSFDPAITSFSSSQCASVCVPWAAMSTREYLHPSTCKKGVSDQPRHLLLI